KMSSEPTLLNNTKNKNSIIIFILPLVSFFCGESIIPAMAQSVTESGDVLISLSPFPAAPKEPARITSPSWVTDKHLIVGNSGSGNIAIKDGGTVAAPAGLIIGFEDKSSGMVNVDGAASRLRVGYINVGSNGYGELNIINGGQANTNNATTIAAGNGQGVVNIDGIASDGVSSTLHTSTLIVGNGDKGTLNVTNGGTLYSDYYSTLSNSFESSGTVTISGVHPSGIASIWRAETIELGVMGNGTLNVFDGGTVFVKNSITAGPLGGTGILNVSGVNMGHASTFKTGSGVSLGVAGIFEFPNAYGTGTLNISDGGVFDAPLIQLGVDNNTAGTINIGTGGLAGVLKTPVVTTGTGDAAVNFSHTDNIDFSTKLSGHMAVTKSAIGTTTLMTASDYTGTTTVSEGALKAGAENVLSQSSDFTLDGPGTLSLNDHDQSIKTLNNAGTVDFGSVAGTTLTVRNNYTGNNGTLLLHTRLGDDSSVTDRFVVNGDTSGTTNIRVSNDGGAGAQTNKGIELIHVNGKSDGNFLLHGRVVAGGYDYFLHKGTPEAEDGNWYLRSELPEKPVPPEHPVTPPEHPVTPPENPVTPPEKPVVIPENPPKKPSYNILRPEAGVYTANTAAANTLFITSLHDRLGETYYTDVFSRERKITSMWMRNTGGHNNWRDSSGTLNTQSNRYVLQIGGDVAQWVSPDNGRIHFGVMAGYGNQKTRTRSSITKYQAKGAVDGYSAGIYGIWQQNEVSDDGAYMDIWAQYNWFNNHIKGEQINDESYKSRGFVASVEAGYTMKMGEFTGSHGSINTWYVQPQAQITWMGVKANAHTEASGTNVESQGDGNIQTRLGLRTYLKGHSSQDKGKDRNFEPFIEMNWLHNTEAFGVRMNGTGISQNGARDLGEVKLGTDGQLSSSLNIWGQVSNQIGGNGYNDTQVMLGVKYIF
ncbi:autotransporter outer membrane beta-barrel domain-containing protein, partial [Salmonella enterica]|nr:autotransporter outer membrane beta-barrel domain-containing protein [Salmonella enterica]EEM5353862.1 autotransporter outer membrane beta-barrel domain-containing protein [Salmonella enterica subsp. enterica serovar Newport]EJU1753906.1 autotransporter outer membrane beta-barrel domain-containing protein [Salmonella enterica]